MIRSKADHRAYLDADRIALRREHSIHQWYDEVWKFHEQNNLRKQRRNLPMC